MVGLLIARDEGAAFSAVNVLKVDTDTQRRADASAWPVNVAPRLPVVVEAHKVGPLVAVSPRDAVAPPARAEADVAAGYAALKDDQPRLAGAEMPRRPAASSQDRPRREQPCAAHTPPAWRPDRPRRDRRRGRLARVPPLVGARRKAKPVRLGVRKRLMGVVVGP